MGTNGLNVSILVGGYIGTNGLNVYSGGWLNVALQIFVLRAFKPRK